MMDLYWMSQCVAAQAERQVPRNGPLHLKALFAMDVFA